jgi:hypothetical protein
MTVGYTSTTMSGYYKLKLSGTVDGSSVTVDTYFDAVLMGVNC